jgi:hypothetical protein
MSFTLPIEASPQMKLAIDFVDGANAANVPRMTANLAKDFMYKAATPSLSFGPHTSSEFSTFLDALFKTVSGMTVGLLTMICVGSGTPFANFFAPSLQSKRLPRDQMLSGSMYAIHIFHEYLTKSVDDFSGEREEHYQSHWSRV